MTVLYLLPKCNMTKQSAIQLGGSDCQDMMRQICTTASCSSGRISSSTIWVTALSATCAQHISSTCTAVSSFNFPPSFPSQEEKKEGKREPESLYSHNLKPFTRITANRQFVEVANDAELPGLEADLENVHISVLWKPMLSLFVGEIEYLEWAQKVSSQHRENDDEDSAMEIVEHVRDGRVDTRTWFMGAMDIVATATDHTDAAVRRLRLERIEQKLRASGVEIPKELLPTKVGVPRHVMETQENIDWASDDEDEYPGPELRRGDFYDGRGMMFEGKRETNQVEEDLGIELHWRNSEEDSDDDDDDPGMADTGLMVIFRKSKRAWSEDDDEDKDDM